MTNTFFSYYYIMIYVPYKTSLPIGYSAAILMLVPILLTVL